MLRGFVVFSLIAQLGIAISSNDDLGEVVFVNILYRHGDRTPIVTYPNDPYRNISYWPVGWGELTDIGKRCHYELGKWLRQRYSKLLPTKYYRSDIRIQSTDVDRTLMSAYSNLAGLYEPDMKKNWSPDIKWDPIPVHTIPENLDKVLAAAKPCPRYNAYVEELENTDTFKKIRAENKDLYDYLSKHTGMPIRGIQQLDFIYNTLFIESLYNLTLPKWTAKVYPQPLAKWSAFSFTLPCYNQKLARLKSGPLIGEMATNMKKKISGKLEPDRKVWMYSAHDITVANTLQALRVFDTQSPPYASLVLIELRKKGDDYFVAIFFRNSSAVPPYFLQLPGCERLCPFKKFSKIIAPIVPDDWEKECQLGTFAGSIYESISGGVLILSVLLTTTFLLFLILGIRLYNERYSTQNDFMYQSLKPEMHS